MYNYPQIPGNYNNSMYRPSSNNSGDRFIGGGFLGPFILGGLVGSLAGPAFYPPRPIPYPVPAPYPVPYPPFY